MAVKKPIVNYGGKYKELQSGDTISGSTTTITQVEVDFGATPVESGVFTVTNGSVSAASKITATLAYDAPTGKDLDELEMDNLNIKAGNATSGSFSLFITSSDGSYLHDKFKINYLIG